MGRGAQQFIYWLGAANFADPTSVGPAQRQLSDLAQFSFPVLPGFLLSADAFFATLSQTKIQQIDWNKPKTVAAASKAMVSKIKQVGLPTELVADLDEAYEQLLRRIDSTGADLVVTAAVTGHAYQQLSIPERLIIRRKSQLKTAVIELYCSLYAAKNLNPHIIEELRSQKIGLSILFQPVVPSASSGILEPGSPTVVRAIFGRVEPLIGNHLTGDRYVVDVNSMEILARDRNRQSWQITSLAASAKHQKVKALDQTSQKITDDQILELAKWSVALGDHGDLLPNLVWQIDDLGRIWITTVMHVNQFGEHYNLPTDPAAEYKIATGQPLAIGTAVGPVRIITHRRELGEVEVGDILLTETADLVPRDQVETITDLIAGWLIESGQVKPATLEVLEENGTPLIRQSGLMHQLQSGMLVTIDGQSGLIYRGRVKPRPNITTMPVPHTSTATKILLKPTDLSEPENDAAAPSDGVGWLSAGAVLAQIGEHPRFSLEKSSRLLLNQSADILCQVASSYQPRPVIYTVNDLTSDEYRKLAGGDIHEKEESNPLLGYRGAHRSLREPDLLKIEFEAVRRVREDYGFTNLHLMLPFVRTRSEFTAVYHLAIGSGLRPGRDFQIWLLCQVPANLVLLSELVKEDLIHGVCLDLDSLTQLLLGVDHANPQLVDEFDVRDQTVMKALTDAIATAREAGLPVTAVGRTLEQYPDAIEGLIAAGITGLVVDPEDLQSIRQIAASAEQRLILDHVLDL